MRQKEKDFCQKEKRRPLQDNKGNVQLLFDVRGQKTSVLKFPGNGKNSRRTTTTTTTTTKKQQQQQQQKTTTTTTTTNYVSRK